LDNNLYRRRSADWSKLTVPFLSAANWAGFGLHPRGNLEAFTQAVSTQKCLGCHPGRHEEWFYLDQGMALQNRFLAHFLKGLENEWDEEPPVLVHLRRPFSDEHEPRKEPGWPLPDTQWTNIYLDGASSALAWDAPAKDADLLFLALGNGITFMSQPLQKDIEITGPLASKLYASSSTSDLDLFVTFQAFSPKGKEVDFQGTVDPHTPLAQGWLRPSHRRLDQEKTSPSRPYHSHDVYEPFEPGKPYELDGEIWPTHILLPAGYQLALHIGGKDFERELLADTPNEAWISRGSDPWLHTLEQDGPRNVLGGTTTILTGPSTALYLLFPIIGDR
jgi:uncharacterized protein